MDLRLGELNIHMMRHFSTYMKFCAGLPVLLGCRCKRVTRSLVRTFFKLYLLLQFLSYRAQIFVEYSLIYCLQIAIPFFWYFACNHFYGCSKMKNVQNFSVFEHMCTYWSIKMVTGKISKKWYSNLKTICQRAFHENLSPVTQKL